MWNKLLRRVEKGCTCTARTDCRFTSCLDHFLWTITFVCCLYIYIYTYDHMYIYIIRIHHSISLRNVRPGMIPQHDSGQVIMRSLSVQIVPWPWRTTATKHGDWNQNNKALLWYCIMLVFTEKQSLHRIYPSLTYFCPWPCFFYQFLASAQIPTPSASCCSSRMHLWP